MELPAVKLNSRGSQATLTLYLNGVTYEYEPLYEHPLPKAGRGAYTPDFRLTESRVYIEHFGVRKEAGPGGTDRLTTAPYIDRDSYLEDMAWKRQVHAEHGTTLVETYSYERVEGRLTSALAEKLEPRLTLTPLAAASASRVRREIASRSGLRHQRHDADGQVVRLRHVAGDEADTRVAERQQEGGVAAETIELGDDERCAGDPRQLQRLLQFGPVVPAAALHLGEAGEDGGAARLGIVLDRPALRREAEPGAALPRRRDPLVGDELSEIGLVPLTMYTPA